jgi:cysteine synthase A
MGNAIMYGSLRDLERIYESAGVGPLRIYDTVESLIGQTPLVRLRQLSERTQNAVVGKLESKNPGGSVKDRIAWAMIRDAEESGRLRIGGTIIEPTSGNTGIGLAMVAAARGYQCILVMPESSSLERRMLFAAYGAEVQLTPGGLGMRGAIEQAEMLVQNLPGAIILRQFDNAANPMIHEWTTGPEIWNDTDGQVDVVFCGIGTGGTATGVARYLKQRRPLVRMIGIEPEESQVLRGGHAGPHKIQGIGAGFVPPILDRHLIDRVISVPDEAALMSTQRLPKEEGLVAGISSGAAYWATEQLLQEGVSGSVVTIFADSGERYLSTGLYQPTDDDWLRRLVPDFF